MGAQSYRVFFLHAKEVPAAEKQAHLEEKIKELQGELGEAREKIAGMEDENRKTRLSMSEYRMRWINEERRATALELFGSDAPCMSQADWLASSPEHSYGTFGLFSRGHGTHENIVDDQEIDLSE